MNYYIGSSHQNARGVFQSEIPNRFCFGFEIKHDNLSREKMFQVLFKFCGGLNKLLQEHDLPSLSL